MDEPHDGVWVLVTGWDYLHCDEMLGAFPDPEEAAAYLESLGTSISGNWIGSTLVPGWRKCASEWRAEIQFQSGGGGEAEIKRVPWQPALGARTEQEANGG